MGGHPIERGKQLEDGENQCKNKGASGDVAENKGEAKSEMLRVPGSLATKTASGGERYEEEAA
jgi:hypothetical protein